MPPNKAKKATAATPARASRSSVPATVTTTRGKEIETTAALARPRRAAPATTTTTTPAVKAKKPATKTTAKPATVTPAATKKRGRPAKTQDDEAEPPKKRGRPSTKKAAKVSAAKPAAKKTTTARKTKTLEPEEAPDALDTPAPRKRHSGPKGGETTKIATDDGAAADQLEEELVETAESTTKRKAPAAKKGKGKAAASTSGKQYWLLKAEQIDREETLKSGRVFNSKFTIDDLKNRTAPEPWDGVRNLVARNNMRAMSKGDLAFFYASQGKGKLQPGITGIMEIVKEAEADQSVFDEDHYGYVEPEKRKAANQWSLVHVEYRKKLSNPVTLKELQKFGKTEGGVLSDMEVLKTTRLSVTKVTEKEWDFIVKEIIGDEYEEDEAAAAASGDELPAITTTEAPTAGAVAVDPPVVKAFSRQASRAASLQPSLALPVVQSTEAVTDAIDSAFPTSDVAKPASRAGSLKPASRAGSVKPSSRAGSVKPASRAGSLAPPVRASSRGRSRTPKPAAVEEATVEQHEQLNSIMEEDGL
nr:hypothetical protein B0A51_16928 [Rachicladosporium sp. CCFEE 5018]